MPRPTSSTTLQRPDLGVLAYEYMLDSPSRRLIGLNLMPPFAVMEQSADYPIIPIEAVLKVQDTRRNARGYFNRGDWQFETGTYSCEGYGWEEPIDDVEAALYERYFDAEMVCTEIAIDRIMLRHEISVATLFETGGSDSDVTTEWSTASTATPLADINDGKIAMRAASGILPNALAMSWTVFRNLMVTSEITTAFRYTNPIEIGGEEAQRRILASYFGVDQVFVGGGIKDTAKKGQSKVISDVWDDEYVHLVRVSDGGPRLREPVYGRTFLWSKVGANMVNVDTYYEDRPMQTIVRARQHVDEGVIFSGAKYTLGNITA
jgi:hypothetical protein